MKTSTTITEITKALVKAQMKIKHAKLDSKNPHFNSDYASLESVINATKEHLLENDIVVMQSPEAGALVTRLQHTSGEYFESEMALMFNKQDMQGMGSAITYASRYSLEALLNISEKKYDDDGNQAAGEASDKGNEEKKGAIKPSSNNIKKLIGAYLGLNIHESQILAKYKIKKPDEITQDIYQDLVMVWKEIGDKKLPAKDFFPVRNHANGASK
ncbi:MAG: ERF family protein [Nitrosomonas sp.]|nr:ERF family protein [Nitrosomonas sp.]